ncbi:MAG: aminoacyl-tRNA hydrolase [Leptospiraceae bacterium]|nr:aminoacyl-tRNA hydrolase [Leptospiraceae bacterium]MDW7975619.1 aminoacyl-tRNA hydrolase [Leptospiraceae bacterium]
MKLIIGLGNPGEKYQNRRSNIGFKILDIIANNNNIEIRTKKKKSLIGRGSIDDEEIVLLKPQTYANLAGEAALYIASFLRVKPKDIVVIMDDITLPLGKIAVDVSKQSFGHPAIENLANSLKSWDFIKVRVGIANKKTSTMAREEFINQEFEPQESFRLINIINDAEAAIREIAHAKDINEIIQKFSE